MTRMIAAVLGLLPLLAAATDEGPPGQTIEKALSEARARYRCDSPSASA